MSTIATERQALNPSALIELFVLDMSLHNAGTLLFCSTSNPFVKNVVWQGNEYVALPIIAAGFAQRSSGSLPRPTIKISNYQGLIGAQARETGDLLGSRVEYSPGCGANREAMTVHAAATENSGTAHYLMSSLPQPDGWFDMGAMTFTSGRNAGLSRSVKSFGSGMFRFSLPLPFPPEAGDMFSVYPGCPKTAQACREKFNNDKFRGFPFIPPAETAT